MVSVTDDDLLGIVPGLLLPKVIGASQPTLSLQLFSSVRPSVTSKSVILCRVFFYKHEPCGQCTSCREGMLNMLNRMVEDRAWYRIEVNTSWIHACLPVSSSSSSAYSRLNATNKLNGRRSARLVQHDPSKAGFHASFTSGSRNTYRCVPCGTRRRAA